MKLNTMKSNILIAVIGIAFAMSANAEYRCTDPQTPQDKTACDLVKQDRPDDLRLFIERTAPIYGLYFYDYVTQKDIDRWDLAREQTKQTPARTAAK